VVRPELVDNRLLKRIGLPLALLLVLPVLGWLRFLVSDGLLSGLTVGGEAVPSKLPLAERALRERAEIWRDATLGIALGEGSDARAMMRSELGAALPVESVLGAARGLGRSGNPFIDLQKWLAALRGRLDVRWLPNIDAQKLARFVDREQLRVERLPVAGVTDGQGFTLPGRDGTALDHATATRLLSRALVSGATNVRLPLQRVPAPAPIEMGSPDGALFDASDETPAPEQPVVASSSAYEPHAWQVANEDDCYSDPPQRPFCDGPRKVPLPFGAGLALAGQLGLGKLDTVGKLIRQSPAAAWVRAAGGPGNDASLTWPVEQGKLGRGFGYVRRPELRDRIHAGVDIVAPRGSLIRAAAAGIVAYSDNRVRGYGNLLVIVHDSGAVTLSAHCQRIFVFAGERVQRGQVVGEVGMTGLAMGPHLHFEYHIGGQASDPEPHFARAPAPPKP
jgi:hypothetical protein